MFSASLELILNIAYREAASRRHTHLTLEHLLYTLAHDPEGERILAGCGADLPVLRRTLDEFLGTLETRGRNQHEPAQTLGFRRVLQTAVLHVQSAGREEVRSGDVLAAILQQPKAYAAQLLDTQGITRLDVLNYISHGITKKAGGAGQEAAPDGGAAGGRRGCAGRGARPAGRVRGQPHPAGAGGTPRPADRAHRGAAPDDGNTVPAAQEQPGIRRRCRRRQDGPG